MSRGQRGGSPTVVNLSFLILYYNLPYIRKVKPGLKTLIVVSLGSQLQRVESHSEINGVTI
jgi:hypothetical protein